MVAASWRWKLLALALLALVSIASADDKRDQLAERIKRFKAMSDQEKSELRDRWKRFQKLPPERQKQLRENARALRRQPGKRRRDLMRRHREFQKMPREKRRKLLSKQERVARIMRRLLSELSPEQRDQLSKMNPMERREEQRKLFMNHMVERKLSHIPAPIAGKIRQRLGRLPFAKRMRVLRQAVMEYSPGAITMLRRRYGMQVRKIVFEARKRGEGYNQIVARVEQLLAKKLPDVSAARRKLLARGLVRGGKRTGPRRGTGRNGFDRDRRPRTGPKRGSPRRGGSRRGSQ